MLTGTLFWPGLLARQPPSIGPVAIFPGLIIYVRI